MSESTSAICHLLYAFFASKGYAEPVQISADIKHILRHLTFQTIINISAPTLFYNQVESIKIKAK